MLLFQEPDQMLYKQALECLRTEIRASTTSMTSVPKPLKFLRPHYGTLKKVYEKITNMDVKVIVKFINIFHVYFDLIHVLTSIYYLNINSIV